MRGLERFAQHLDENQTIHERLVYRRMAYWCEEKDILFHTQVAMRGYILDFYFPQLDLGIELDGRRHNPQRDSQRDAHLLKNGVNVIRFKNPKCRADLNAIFYRIYAEARFKLKGRWKPGKHRISTDSQASQRSHIKLNTNNSERTERCGKVEKP